MAFGSIHSGTMQGKLNGVMQPTTPTGCRSDRTSTPVAACGEKSPFKELRDAARELDALQRALHLAARVGQRLAVLRGDDGGQLGLVADDRLPHGEQHMGALADRRVAPSALGLDRHRDGGVDLLDRGQVDLGRHLPGGRVVDGGGAPGGAWCGATGDDVTDVFHRIDGTAVRVARLGPPRRRSGVDFATMMQLDDQGEDVYLARGPQYPWGGLYGGQIIAQGLRAGAATVDERFHVHSLHAYFIRRGNADEPIRLEVTRSRDGRSFVTRSVVCRQETGVILTMSLSFHVDEAGHDVQTAQLPDIPGPDEVSGYTWSTMFDRRFAQLRNAEEGKGVAWMRMKDPVGDDPILQACAVAYLSDDLPTDAVVALHPERPAPGEGDAFELGWMSASLDHAIWFHRPSRADEWHVHDFTSHGYLSSRGLSIGHVLSQDGIHVATIAQEVLLRKSS